MCELLAISSRRPTRLSFSLAALVERTTPGHSARDGWGVAYYQGGDVTLHRETAPASDSPLARALASAGPPTTLALSHIRHATRGAITLANTQPFVRALGGRSHVFAHNGDLPGLMADPRFARTQFHPLGETDSEHAGCALLARLAPLWRGSRAPTLQARLEVVADFAAGLREFGPANFLYADGEALFAHGHRRLQPDGRIAPPGLHWLQRSCAHPDEALQAEGLHVGAGYQQVLLLASVPLSGEPWQALAEGETVAIGGGQLLARRPPRTAS